jgi:hypothetical protein
MKLTISGAVVTPKWTTLEKMVATALDRAGRFSRIARRGAGCDYRAPGVYDVTFRPDSGDAVAVVIEVTR